MTAATKGRTVGNETGTKKTAASRRKKPQMKPVDLRKPTDKTELSEELTGEQQQAQVNEEPKAEETVNEEPKQEGGLLSNLKQSNDQAPTGNRSNQLSATADLTRLATSLATNALKEIDQRAELKDSYEASLTDHNAMDRLLDELNVYDDLDVDFMKDSVEDELEKMLRSQQSKRSRAKSVDPMTLENYKTMMTAAIAENIIRMVAKKPKGNGGPAPRNSELTEETLAYYAANQDELKKAIRNVQSKKSIMKAKEGFSEEDDRWKALCDAEDALKSVRANENYMPRQAKVELEAKKKAEDLLKEVPADIDGEAAKELLNKLKEVLATTDEDGVVGNEV